MTVLAWLGISESQSRLKPGQSCGFQAKPGRKNTRPNPRHQMYKVSRSFLNGQRNAGIISVDSIICSVHLFPRFGSAFPREWNSFTVLDKCNSFYINPFTDMYSYLMFA